VNTLLDYDLDALTALVQDLGQPKFRATQLYQGLQNGLDVAEISNLPKSFVEQIYGKASGFFGQPQKIKEQKSQDGTVKYLFSFFDNECVETVYLPNNYGGTICVSTQVGCRMDCAFCASGLQGLKRNLSVGEILGQVVEVNRLHGGNTKKRAISNIVLMGSGEPLDNFESVVDFVERVSDPQGLGISKRNISLSTCGLVDKMKALADSKAAGVTLTISLHATTDEYRQQIMPIAKSYNLAQIFAASKDYFEKTGRRIVFEYALIKGVNTHHLDTVRLAALTKGLPCHINLIRLNPVKERGLDGIGEQEAKKFLQKLKDSGLSATLRRRQGVDIDGACGQLRNNYTQKSEEAKQAKADRTNTQAKKNKTSNT